MACKQGIVEMIALCAGHYPLSPGACWEGRCEHPEAAEWIAQIAGHLGPKRCIVVPTGRLQEKVKSINHQGYVIAVDLHFNSDPDHGGKGCETLYCPGSKHGRRAAEIVHAHMAKLIKPDRGVKPGWYRMDPMQGPDYFLRYTDCIGLIIEPEFIHNHEKIDTVRKDACKAIADGLLEYHKLYFGRSFDG